MSKVLVVFGATGQQGGSVVDFVLNDAELSKQYSIRAITRSTTSSSAQKLQAAGAEVVYADVDDVASMNTAFKGAHTVFGATFTVYDEHLKEREIRQGKALTDAAVRAGVQYLIFSSLSSPNQISGGKLPVASFDSKWEVEQYIRAQPIRSAFFAPGAFMENFQTFWQPRPAGDGSDEYSITSIVSPETVLPHIAIAADTGKWVGAILADPDKYEGKVIAASSGLYTMQQTCEVISAAKGKIVKYNRIPESTFRGFMPATEAEPLVAMLKFIEQYGYFGADTKDLVAWSAQQARGKLTSFEDFARDNIKLE